MSVPSWVIAREREASLQHAQSEARTARINDQLLKEAVCLLKEVTDYVTDNEELYSAIKDFLEK